MSVRRLTAHTGITAIIRMSVPHMDITALTILAAACFWALARGSMGSTGADMAVDGAGTMAAVGTETMTVGAIVAVGTASAAKADGTAVKASAAAKAFTVAAASMAGRAEAASMVVIRSTAEGASMVVAAGSTVVEEGSMVVADPTAAGIDSR